MRCRIAWAGVEPAKMERTRSTKTSRKLPLLPQKAKLTVGSALSADARKTSGRRIPSGLGKRFPCGASISEYENKTRKNSAEKTLRRCAGFGPPRRPSSYTSPILRRCDFFALKVLFEEQPLQIDSPSDRRPRAECAASRPRFRTVHCRVLAGFFVRRSAGRFAALPTSRLNVRASCNTAGFLAVR